MIEAETRPSILRSIAAVVAGVIVIFILSLGTDVLMHATGVFPPWFQPMSTQLFIFALGYRIVYGVIGGYVTARFARLRPMAHAIALGLVGIVLSMMGVIGTWNKGPEFGPRWYPISLVLISLPCAWLGGKLWTMRSR
jgi:hypothetical protein